uniref:Vacuolar protein sorting-associated protein 51 homolog n=1 Tax=Haemonchus contortus TaxID=6289 RepID=A0A7I4XZC6_HAECO|nr:Vps51 Vps67 domain containing protein [Haemonchus contortus]
MSQKVGVLDVTSPDFDVDAYLSSQLKEKNLDELVKEEEEMVSSVRRLDSDVHQLVYENYNKFLTATSTVRKIQDEFNLLDSEMESLSRNMKNISSLIGELSGVLGGGREGVAQLGSSYKVVKSLQSIFELPNILQASFDEGKYNDVVRVYLLAQKGLSKYSDIKNIAEIQKKTDKIISETKKQLIRLISNSTEDVEGVAEATGLLMKLGKTSEELQELLLKSAEASLRNDLKLLQSNPVDVLDLVDKGCESFIPNLTLLANLHERLFPNNSDLLLEMLKIQLADFHEIVSSLFLATSDPKDCSIVVRALDRYYRKMSTCKQVVQGLDCSTCTISLIRDVSKHEVVISRKYISEEMKVVLQEIRQTLMAKDIDLPALAAKLEQAFVFQVKTALANLLLFIASDVTFSSLPPSEFQAEFARSVHEEIVIGAFKDVTAIAETYGSSEGETRYANPLMMLLIAFTLHHLANKSSQYLLSLCREQFSLTTSKTGVGLTGVTDVTTMLKTCSQALLRRFAKLRGLELGEALVKGCEGLRQPAASPAGVRSAVRRAVEEVLECDSMLSRLLGGETGRKENRHRRTTPAPSATDSSRDSLWCERIDFNQQLHFNRASIIGAIVKVLLKSFIESIRQQTYGKYAVEQIQVDCYYLQRGVSPLVADEVTVNSMVDQALSSALKRCVAPELVHPTRLRQICEEKTD